jgi:hypothetical protein
VQRVGDNAQAAARIEQAEGGGGQRILRQLLERGERRCLRELRRRDRRLGFARATCSCTAQQ